MICNNCGSEVIQGSSYCSACGVTMQQPFQQPYPQNYSNQSIVNDKVSILLNFVAFYFPLVGLIMYLIMKGTTPKKAKAIGFCSILGFILEIVLLGVMTILFINFVGSLAPTSM